MIPNGLGWRDLLAWCNVLLCYVKNWLENKTQQSFFFLVSQKQIQSWRKRKKKKLKKYRPHRLSASLELDLTLPARIQWQRRLNLSMVCRLTRRRLNSACRRVLIAARRRRWPTDRGGAGSRCPSPRVFSTLDGRFGISDRGCVVKSQLTRLLQYIMHTGFTFWW